MRAEAAVASGLDWKQALDEIRQNMPMLEEERDIHLALFFAHSAYSENFHSILAEVRRLTHADVLIGCSGQGIIGPGHEIEHEPAMALQAFSIPGASLHPVRLSKADIVDPAVMRLWADNSGVAADKVSAWLAFADPFLDSNQMLASMAEVFPGVPVIGGLASNHREQRFYLFLDDDVYQSGAVALAVGGDYKVTTVVSQGCEPVGQAWTVTEAQDNVIYKIGMRPAYEVLIETYRSLPENIQRRARSNLFIGLAMNEYKDEFAKGDFLIRNLLEIDQRSGALVVGALVRPGQTIQFQLRDPQAAHEELQHLIGNALTELDGTPAVGVLLCCCNGRGISLFGASDHDVNLVQELLGPLPVAGFFCNGELGPVGGRNFLHGYTASMAIIAPANRPPD